VDPFEFDDTSSWLGNPTKLETVKHYAAELQKNLAWMANLETTDQPSQI
jgi:hypothetical protein